MLRLTGVGLRGLRLLAPESVRKLGYPDPMQGAEDNVHWFEQAAAEGARYAVVTGTRTVAGSTLVAATVSYSPADGGEVVAVARGRPGSSFVAKLFMGGDFEEFRAQVRSHYEDVKVVRPEATRGASMEVYLVGLRLKPASP